MLHYHIPALFSSWTSGSWMGKYVKILESKLKYTKARTENVVRKCGGGYYFTMSVLPFCMMPRLQVALEQ